MIWWTLWQYSLPFELNIITKNMVVEQWKNEIDKINVDWFEWIVRNFSGFSIKWFENILC